MFPKYVLPVFTTQKVNEVTCHFCKARFLQTNIGQNLWFWNVHNSRPIDASSRRNGFFFCSNMSTSSSIHFAWIMMSSAYLTFVNLWTAPIWNPLVFNVRFHCRSACSRFALKKSRLITSPFRAPRPMSKTSRPEMHPRWFRYQFHNRAQWDFGTCCCRNAPKWDLDAVKRLLQTNACKPNGAIPLLRFATGALENNECIFNTHVWCETCLVETLFPFHGSHATFHIVVWAGKK